MKDWSITDRLLVLAIAWLLLGGNVPGLPSFATKPTAVVYTFEKDSGSVPPPVLAALDKLNRQGIVATNDEVDTPDGTGDVPDQYKVSRPAAVAAGLPALVVMGGDKVIRVVKPVPDTEAGCLEAVK